MHRLLQPKFIGPFVVAFGVLLLMGAYALDVTAEPATAMPMTVQQWGWIFSGVGLAMMYLKVPPVIGRVWALIIIGLIAYIIAVSVVIV